MGEQPFLSIIMPVYNRPQLVVRAIRSCLEQDYGSFEIVVIDDGSTDDTVDVVRGIPDQRVRAVQQPVNQGPGPARNAGMAVARGAWFLFFDSDDELVPGALGRIAQASREAEPDIGMLRFMCRDDNGRLSPDPPHELETWDLHGYLRWAERTVHGLSEAISCVRASTWPGMKYPPGYTHELIYNLDIARRYRVRTFPDVVRLYHGDASEQITRGTVESSLRFAPTWGPNADLLMERYGEDMRRVAPTMYDLALYEGLLAHMLNGARFRGLAYGARLLRRRPTYVRGLATIALGMVGPRAVARIRAARNSRRAQSALQPAANVAAATRA